VGMPTYSINVQLPSRKWSIWLVHELLLLVYSQEI
jgi:hypothetical protein